jgi:hypothetical protein
MAEQNAKMALKMNGRGYVLEFGQVAMEGEGRTINTRGPTDWATLPWGPDERGMNAFGGIMRKCVFY